MNIFSSNQEDISNEEGVTDECQASLGRVFDAKIRGYIDLVDKLRNLGLDHELDLPCIIVLGDQSSGKSSILEATSGVQLPRGNDMCTRCPLEMQLKKSHGQWRARLSYRKDGEKEVVKEIMNPDDVGPAVREAQDAVRGKDPVSRTRLTLRVESADCPDLTMIDLPGIVRGHENPSVDSGIRSLIDFYIRRPGAIILCVIPAPNDLETNEARAISRKEDPNQTRTIGVITKPDLVDDGDEKRVLRILENHSQPLKLGYVMVRCRNIKETMSNTSLQRAREEEEAFFRKKFRSAPAALKGIHNLSEKLTKCLVSNIKARLPDMLENARRMREELRQEDEELGTGLPTEPMEKRRYLQEQLARTRDMMAAAFGDGIRVPSKLLSSRNVDVEDEEDMYNSSHLWRSLSKWFSTEIDNLTTSHLHLVNGRLNVDRIKQKIVAYRSTELPKFPSYKVLQELVQDHVKDYRQTALDCLNETADGVERIGRHVCEKTLSSTPGLQNFMEERMRSVLSECQAQAKNMVLMEVDKELQVYSQDKTYLRELQQLEAKQRRQSRGSDGSRTGSDGGSESSNNLSFQVLSHGVDQDEEKHNAELMQQLIQVYLEVANRRFVDNVPLTIRLSLYTAFVKKFQEKIHSILASDEAVEQIHEDPERAQMREECSRRLRSLTQCVELLNKEL